jgi:hypothetical protein
VHAREGPSEKPFLPTPQRHESWRIVLDNGRNIISEAIFDSVEPGEKRATDLTGIAIGDRPKSRFCGPHGTGDSNLEYRKLGQTGIVVSNLGLGTMYFGSETPEEDVFAIMDAFVEAGETSSTLPMSTSAGGARKSSDAGSQAVRVK